MDKERLKLYVYVSEAERKYDRRDKLLEDMGEEGIKDTSKGIWY